MEGIVDIGPLGMALAYLLLLVPLAILFVERVPLLRESVVAVARMSIQLLFVGLYLQVVFRLDNAWLNLAWVGAMVAVADGSVLRGCRLRVRRFALPLFLALLAGTLLPVGVLVAGVLGRGGGMEAQYVIPLAGMVLGNCLRADIIGLKRFYEGIAAQEGAFHHRLAQGASLREALEPHVQEALQSALLPTIASMATIGLVALPGMMTGVILAGRAPVTAVKYQVAIMVAIFTGTAVTLLLAGRLTARRSFDAYGLLDRGVFANGRPAEVD